MDYQFHEWFVCPECGEQADVAALAHDAELVFECYECGLISEFDVGEDVPLRNLDADAVAGRSDERA